MSHVSPADDLPTGSRIESTEDLLAGSRADADHLRTASRVSGDRSRPDACPGALQVHQAADGGLARVRVPGGALTAEQLRALGNGAVTFSDGHLELTSRGNVQLRGLCAGDEARLAQLLHMIGLLPSASHERVRNILASPLSGRDGLGALDVRPLVTDLDRALCARMELAELPGRFLFTLDDGRGDVAGLEGDVGVLALSRTEVALLLAGEDSGLRVSPVEAVRTVLAAARAFLAERAAQGSTAWRLAELNDGVARVTGRLRSGVGPSPRDALVPQHVLLPREHGPVGLIEQRDGSVALAVAAPLGRLSARQAEILARAADDGGGGLRITPWRGVVVCDLPPARAEHWSSTMDEHGLVADPASPWVGVSACTGRPGCAKALADVRTDAIRTLRVATGVRDVASPVHWAGCARRCGRPRGRVVEVVAAGDGYQVVRDGIVVARASDIKETAAAVAAARRDQ
ncbi:precorrin-3B synthase [Longimycelium tulufanense]|uniref:Precorrin-3B synthase n=1 Tax=Longimycelium tulufanense TaxID=907463 RepID=A0A8J3CCB1_9PSEU|nr:precorrin-3B synthase [Longimycelium tulufanense]GGM72977.1 precorrin-3B synthase [Longimycelium tulufanense]